MKNPVAQKLGHGEMPWGNSAWFFCGCQQVQRDRGMVSATGLGGSKLPGLSRGGGEEAQKSELCQKAKSRAGEPCCQSNMDELESGKSWVQSSLMS